MGLRRKPGRCPSVGSKSFCITASRVALLSAPLLFSSQAAVSV